MVATLKTSAVKEAEVEVVAIMVAAEMVAIVEAVAVAVAAEVEVADTPRGGASTWRTALNPHVHLNTLKDGLPQLLQQVAASLLVANEAVTATPKGLPQWEAGMILQPHT